MSDKNLSRYVSQEIEALKDLSNEEEKLLLDVKELFGGTLEIPDIPFVQHLARHKKRMKHYEQSRNADWKFKFLNRLAPIKINCCLKYEKPVKKGSF